MVERGGGRVERERDSPRSSLRHSTLVPLCVFFKSYGDNNNNNNTYNNNNNGHFLHFQHLFLQSSERITKSTHTHARTLSLTHTHTHTHTQHTHITQHTHTHTHTHTNQTQTGASQTLRSQRVTVGWVFLLSEELKTSMIRGVPDVKWR